MAYEKYNPINTEIGFLSLDLDRVQESITYSQFADLCENVDLSFTRAEISPNTLRFLTSVL